MILVSLYNVCFASQKIYKLVQYRPLSQAECLKNKNVVGLNFCPYNNDHLAGAALACGHKNNLPLGQDLQELAQQVYNKQTSATSIYGSRNDAMLKNMGIFVNDSHIYYWTGEEAKDGEGGYVRMFASKGSIPYYAPRNGSGYVSSSLGKVNYGNTRYIKTKNPKHNSNTAGLPNNDALVTVCYSEPSNSAFEYVP